MTTQARATKMFSYKNGFLIRKTKPRNGTNVGAIVGSKHNKGYLTVRIDDKSYLIHRLVWLWHKGYFPENCVDHINGIKTDNRIENLREISNQCNVRNCGNHKDNTSGVKGISWNSRKRLWSADIGVFRKHKSLGCYKDFSEAVLVRLAAEQCLGWEGCESSSPAYQYAIKNNLIKQ